MLHTTFMIAWLIHCCFSPWLSEVRLALNSCSNYLLFLVLPPHCSSTADSTNRLSPSLSFALFLHSSLNLTKSRFTQSSHISLGCRRILLSSTFRTTTFFANCSCPFRSTCPAHYSRLFNIVFLNISFTPPSSMICQIPVLYIFWRYKIVYGVLSHRKL